MFLLVAPAALGQPFADVPTNHWAYDAIAELAAKGIVEGYPDGTFKGDRAMTRYEMAMVVARLLARIESIQAPAAPAAPAPAPVPAAPPITRVDVETIQRLVAEFRAELAALGVRTTATEEELNAIKARLSNVRITGAYRFRYELRQVASAGPLPGNGNPQTGGTDASANAQFPRPRHAGRLLFDGSVSPDTHLITSVMTSNFVVFNSSGSSAALSTLDTLFFDWRNAFGWPLEIWLGRFGGGGLGGATGIGKTYPVQFGPFGLLLNTTTDQWTDTTLNSGFNVIDGLRVAGRWPAMADLQVQGLIARVVGNTGASTFFSGEDVYGVDANARVLPGLRVGADYVSNGFYSPGNIPTNIPAGTAGIATPGLWHLYGPAGGSLNPATPNCPAVSIASGSLAPGGIACPAAGNGYSGYALWDVAPGIHFDGEYGWWNDKVQSISDTGWQVNVVWDLATLTGIGHNFVVQTGYLNYGQNFYPPYGMVSADNAMLDALYPGNAQGFTGMITYDPTPNWTIFGIGLFGAHNVSNGQDLSEYQAGIITSFAPNSRIRFFVRDVRVGGVRQLLLYRAQLDYTF